jgi:hypothetical protein
MTPNMILFVGLGLIIGSVLLIALCVLAALVIAGRADRRIQQFDEDAGAEHDGGLRVICRDCGAPISGPADGMPYASGWCWECWSRHGNPAHWHADWRGDTLAPKVLRDTPTDL